MEELKKLDEVCVQDVRQDSFAKIDLSHPGRFRRLTVQDFHRAAEGIKLHDGVPENIRSHFQTARNLIVYSWFYYPFNITAELCAYTSVEYALRTKTSDATTPFKLLLKMTVDNGWITDKGFSVPQRQLEAHRAFKAQGGFMAQFLRPEPTLVREYCDILTEAIPKLRNTLAHGSSMLHEHGASTVRICAELINQLWPEKHPAAKPNA